MPAHHPTVPNLAACAIPEISGQMSRKRLILAATISIVIVIAIAGVIVIVAAIWFMSSGTTVAGKPTSVGTPKDSPVTKTIGAEGGTISSSDGRITINVPRQAVSSPTNFSIQPLTNTAPNGLGDGYRLGPNGRTFSSPIKITFMINAAELATTISQSLTVAYQDGNGVWQVLKDGEIDDQKHTYTVPTTHFSDYSLLDGIHIEPPQQRIRPGTSTYLEVVGCKERMLDQVERLLGHPPADEFCGNVYFEGFGGKGGFPYPLFWQADLGSIESGKRKVKYTAPGKMRQFASIGLPMVSLSRF